ncbi:MAG: PEGA domain-containing protein [Patescibacteria group bacterium]|nr:PEGA domain-containing protein [Patescibacteria group bacterium]
MKILSRLIFFVIFIIVLVLVIFYARGYRPDFKNKSFVSTGIITASSYPKTAKIYLNGEFKGLTDINLTLKPGKYFVEIKKDGFTSWNKNIILKGELVVSIDALLFPLNPSLSPLTNLGIIRAIPLEDNNRILVFSKTGIYIFESSKNVLSFFAPLKTIAKAELFPENTDWEKIEVFISPDLKQAIVGNYLLSLEEENQSLFDVSASLSKENLISAWEEKRKTNNLKILETYPKEFFKIASDSFKIISFSPNDNKILYQSLKNVNLPIIINPPLIGTNQTPETRNLKKNHIYVYDKKEDKNYLISSQQSTSNQQISWYFDSKHLVINENKKIIVADYDYQNKQVVYSGPFEKDFFMPTLDGKIIILANLNPEANEYQDLYLVGIR